MYQAPSAVFCSCALPESRIFTRQNSYNYDLPFIILVALATFARYSYLYRVRLTVNFACVSFNTISSKVSAKTSLILESLTNSKTTISRNLNLYCPLLSRHSDGSTGRSALRSESLFLYVFKIWKVLLCSFELLHDKLVVFRMSPAMGITVL